VQDTDYHIFRKEERTMSKIFLILFTLLTINVQTNAQQLTAIEILKKSDSIINAPKDQDLNMKLILTDKYGTEKEREISMIQKGSDKRMIKFLSPADQKGIAFLDLPDDKMYLYLPAFKKVRRISGHIKNQKFAGTDFTYDDMATIIYADEYTPQLMNTSGDHFILSLTPNDDIQKEYSQLRMWIRKDNFYQEKIEYYDEDIKLWKISERRQIEKVGEYWVSKELEIQDLKESHKTTSILEQVKFDTGLNDNLFTQRYMKR
jgi:outer membrane lipoprotein-sorting protein